MRPKRYPYSGKKKEPARKRTRDIVLKIAGREFGRITHDELTKNKH